MLNKKQRLLIIKLFGSLSLLIILGTIIYFSYEAWKSLPDQDAIFEAAIQGITMYGGLLYIAIKFITLFFVTKKTLSKAKVEKKYDHTNSQEYEFNLTKSIEQKTKSERQFLKEVHKELNKKIFAEIRIQKIKELAIGHDSQNAKKIIAICNKKVMIENKINEIKKIGV